MRIFISILLGGLLVLLAYQFFTTRTVGQAEDTRVIPDGEAQAVVMSTRTIRQSERVALPVPGSAPTENVSHSIPVEEIRLGCPRQDCIPSIQDPQFITPTEAAALLPTDALGIALSYKDETRFYPFPMLETREIVNDVVAGDPLLITYCPLCGTGIVFDRMVGDNVLEFGVSGMLWQSNLLMYNRAADVANRNLWSQVLGEAVVGERTGTELTVIPSDITRFADWAAANPEGAVLNSGSIRDPYNGAYYSVASRFAPNFDAATSPLPPMEYVYGIEIDGVYKAYPRVELALGETTDTVNGAAISIRVTESGMVTFTMSDGTVVSDVESFWFSWVAVHPETELWNNN